MGTRLSRGVKPEMVQEIPEFTRLLKQVRFRGGNQSLNSEPIFPGFTPRSSISSPELSPPL